MPGRGIDQILPHPCDPALYESYVKSALAYVELAERANGPIPRPVDDRYVWGDALSALDGARPDARIVNLETSITTSGAFEAKGINYRMNPLNVGVLNAAKIDCCALANNHVRDWNVPGLEDTLSTLRSTGIRYAGAGRDIEEAAAPAIMETAGGRRILVFAFGLASSGVPPHWAATETLPGVNFVAEASEEAVRDIAEHVRSSARADDLLVASIHWGGNWGYTVPRAQRAFAHDLIDIAGFHIVHGHSSHHAKAIELYRGRVILYGCGDFITDYEGISGYEEFRGDLAVAYLPELSGARELVAMTMIPFQMQRFRLVSANEDDIRWLVEKLNGESSKFNTHLKLTAEKTLALDL